MEEQKTVKLTGEPISEEMKSILERLDRKESVQLEEIEDTPEIKLAYARIFQAAETITLEGREKVQERALQELDQMGSASGPDANGKMTYQGDIRKEARLDIVIGLPASGKSSALVDVISQEFHSRIIDNDEAKKRIPEFDNGWGAGVVHRESQKISDKQLLNALSNRENIVLPKVGGSPDKLLHWIELAKSIGYKVNLHYVALDRNKALGRMLNRFLDTGRFLEPRLIDQYCNEKDGNKIEHCYEELKKNGSLDGYSKWDNDVKIGERPILIEARCEGKFVQKNSSMSLKEQLAKAQEKAARHNTERQAKHSLSEKSNRLER